MANIKKLTKEFEQTIANNKEQKEQLKRRIMAAKASVISAKQEMDTAAAADDEHAFIAASDKVRFNESVISANEAKLADLENVQKENLKGMTNKVRTAQEDIAKAAEEKAAAAVYDIYIIATKAQEEIRALEKMLCEYSEEVGNSEPIKGYHYNGALDNLLNLIKDNKNRADRYDKGSVLYAHISE